MNARVQVHVQALSVLYGYCNGASIIIIIIVGYPAYYDSGSRALSEVHPRWKIEVFWED